MVDCVNVMSEIVWTRSVLGYLTTGTTTSLQYPVGLHTGMTGRVPAVKLGLNLVITAAAKQLKNNFREGHP